MRFPYLAVGPLIILSVWYWVTSQHLINPLFLPEIGAVGKKLTALAATKDFHLDVFFTLKRTFIAFGLASTLGVPTGLIMGISKKVGTMFEIVIDFFRSIPSPALFPLFLLVFGIGEASKISNAAFFSFWIILVSTIHGVDHISKTRVKVARSFKATYWQILRFVVLMEALPYIVNGLRVAVSTSFIVVIVTEMLLGTKYGLGQRMFSAYYAFQVPEMYASLLVLGLLGFLLHRILGYFERKTVHWTQV